MTTTSRTRRVALLALALMTSGMVACGGDDDSADASSSPSAADAEVSVVARDIEFDRDRYTAPPGEVTIRYENEGSIVHSLVIEGVDDFRLEVESNGDTDSATVDLEPGSYVIYCDVPGHREAGMEAELEVG